MARVSQGGAKRIQGVVAMSLRHRAQSICALMFLNVCLFGQTVSSGLQGTVLDPANAAVPNAPVTLIEM